MSFSTVSVVGSGPVGCGIAIAIAQVGVPVTIVRATSGEVQSTIARVERRLTILVDSGSLAPSERQRVRARIDVSGQLSQVASSDLVIETTFGDARTRRARLATVEGQLSAGAVLAVNAEARELPQMAEVLRRRDQFVGMRFFHPATHTTLLELGFLGETAPGVVAACRTFCSWLAKTPVETEESAMGYRESRVGGV